MKKALIISTVSRQFYLFEKNNIQVLRALGYEIHGAANFEDRCERLKEVNIIEHPFDIQRSPFNIRNINAYFQLKRIIKEGNYSLIHCHSPMGGVLGRLASRKKRIRVIYTAHGFHFFEGNSFFKNFIYRNVEKALAKYTDILITINKEDYKAAKKFKLRKNGTVEYVPGVGIDLEKINSITGDRAKITSELNIADNVFLLLSVGELNDNKNHQIIIESLSNLADNVHYLICGAGPLKTSHLELAKQLGVENRLHLLGYRSDIIQIMKSCDIFVFPSKREGLSVALMEALACGLPCIVSKIRGNIDLIINKKNGLIIEKNEKEQWLEGLREMIDYTYFNSNNNSNLIQQCDSKKIMCLMKMIYEK